MPISKFPSVTVLPHIKEPRPEIAEYLSGKFPKIPRRVWENRIREGKVLNEKGEAITPATPYSPGLKLQYFREVENEPEIPFREEIIYQDERILVADKPHFLPVNPTGPYVNESLLNRLKEKTGNPDLSPVNRIDMDTAGLVLFSCNPAERAVYHNLFSSKKIRKTYEAVTEASAPGSRPPEMIETRLVKGEPWFVMKTEDGQPNTKTEVNFLKQNGNRVMLRLFPVTGKKHQLRIHLSGCGFRIINDRLYPKVAPEAEPDFSSPLQLLSKTIEFIDPITGSEKKFSTRKILSEGW